MGTLGLFVSAIVDPILFWRAWSGPHHVTAEPMRWSEIYGSSRENVNQDTGKTNRWMKAALPDYYSLLGVTSDASLQQVERQYRLRAAQLHPDRFFQDPVKHAEAERDLKLLIEAVTALRDPVHRAAYDATYAPKPIHSRILRVSQASQ